MNIYGSKEGHNAKPKPVRPISYNQQHQKKESTYFKQSRSNLIEKSIERVSKEMDTINLAEQSRNHSLSRKISNNQPSCDVSWKKSISRTQIVHSGNNSGLLSPAEFNRRLDKMFKDLKQLEKKSHFSPNYSRREPSNGAPRTKSRHDRNSIEMSVTLDKAPEPRHFIKEPKSLIPPKNQLSSIMTISDAAHQSSRLNGFLDSSCRSSQIFPSTANKNNYSIQYYLLHKKLSSQQQLHLQSIQHHKPHRSSITSILVRENSNLTDVYTSSLDYTVSCHKYQSSQFTKVREHRAGVECLYWWNEILLSGGRDCCIRGDQDWYIKTKGVVNKMEGFKRSENILVKSMDTLWQMDLQRRGAVIRQKNLPKGSTLIGHSDNILIGNPNSLMMYDQRTSKVVKLLQTSECINHWQSVNGKVIGIGQQLWIWDLPGLERVKKLPGSGETTSVCEYYHSYLISRKNSDMLVYNTDLDMVSSIGVQNNILLGNTRNKIICAYEDGGLEYCLLK